MKGKFVYFLWILVFEHQEIERYCLYLTNSDFDQFNYEVYRLMFKNFYIGYHIIYVKVDKFSFYLLRLRTRLMSCH